jgi:hypothetical protein
MVVLQVQVVTFDGVLQELQDLVDEAQILLHLALIDTEHRLVATSSLVTLVTTDRLNILDLLTDYRVDLAKNHLRLSELHHKSENRLLDRLVATLQQTIYEDQERHHHRLVDELSVLGKHQKYHLRCP